MRTSPKDVVVVGGGISGLTTAWHLKRAGATVCLLEANEQVGGCTQTETRGGFLLEKGPFNVIVRDPAFEDLLGKLSGEINVVSADSSSRHRYIYRGGRLRPVPGNPITLATTPLLSLPARCRLFTGLLLSPRAPATEETIEQAVVRRFGLATADHVVSAAIAGIYAGDIARLSFSACFPSVARIDGDVRSLMAYGLKAAFRKKKGKRRRWPGMVSLDGGLGAVTTALGRALGDDLCTGCAVGGIHPINDGGYELEYRDRRSSLHTVSCQRLVIATPAARTSRLLTPFLPEAVPLLDGIESASVVVLNLGFRTTDVAHPLKGFGFLVPKSEPDFPLMGVLFADSVFPHHAPRGHRLLRVFLGGQRGLLDGRNAHDAADGNHARASIQTEETSAAIRTEGTGSAGRSVGVCDAAPDAEVGTTIRTTARDSITRSTAAASCRAAVATPIIERTADALLDMTMTALRPLLGITGQPVLVDICRHRCAIPQYYVGHRERIADLRTLIAGKPGLYLVGNYLDGVSLNDCVRLATTVASEIIRERGA